MKEEILAVAPMLMACMPALEEAYSVHRVWTLSPEDRTALLAEVGPRIRAIATDGHNGVDAETMAACPKLEMISGFGVGYDGVDIAACKARGIRVTNTPDVLNDAVAEMAMALMLGLAREVPQIDRYVRAGRWVKEGLYPLTAELTGATLGIVGLGRIGKEIAARAQAFKMRVVYHGRREQAGQPFQYYADLEAMARDVDWLVAIAPATPDTTGIVSRRVMQALGPEGRLVNIARGALVDEPAMVELLQSGGLGGAALDVFVAEPHVPEALFELDNVVLAPHQGSATRKTRQQMGEMVVANLAAFFAGEPLLTPVC